MNLELNARQQRILQLLQTDGEVKIAELKTVLNVTEMTIRRDLEKLESAGAAKRTFGGAIALGNDIALQERFGVMLEEKMRIGKRAAELIQPGESIFLDAGTTALQIARCLPPASNVTIVTNALNAAAELLGKRIAVIVSGGILLEATSSLVGPVAVQTLAGMSFDRAFLGATGVEAQFGFSNSNVYEAEVKKLVIRQSAEINIVLDHTKFGTRALCSFAALHQTHRVICDRGPDDGLQAAFAEAGVRTELA